MRYDTRIVTAGIGYKAPTLDEYRRVHHAALDEIYANTGVLVTVHEDATETVARVNYGRWMVDCRCGSGALADPAFPEARCFYCGAVIHPIRFPPMPDRVRLEQLLVVRPIEHRHWRPNESIESLADDNAEHGLGGA